MMRLVRNFYFNRKYSWITLSTAALFKHNAGLYNLLGAYGYRLVSRGYHHLLNYAGLFRSPFCTWRMSHIAQSLWHVPKKKFHLHYSHAMISAMAASQNNSVSIVCSSADQRKHQSSMPLALVRGIHRWPDDSPDEGPITRKMVPFDDVIM